MGQLACSYDQRLEYNKVWEGDEMEIQKKALKCCSFAIQD